MVIGGEARWAGNSPRSGGAISDVAACYGTSTSKSGAYC